MKIENCLYLHFCYNTYQETHSVPAHMLGVMKQFNFNIKDLLIVNKDIVQDILTNEIYGANFPTEYIDDLTNFSDFSKINIIKSKIYCYSINREFFGIIFF